MHICICIEILYVCRDVTSVIYVPKYVCMYVHRYVCTCACCRYEQFSKNQCSTHEGPESKAYVCPYSKP